MILSNIFNLTLLTKQMEGHDVFFQRVVNMIPRDLYKAEETDDLNERYFKHRQMPLQPAERKKISKKRKGDKYGLNEVSNTRLLHDPLYALLCLLSPL